MRVVVNGEDYAFDAISPTLAELINTLGFTGKRIAVERNGIIVPKSQYPVTILEEADCLEIIVAVGGG